MHASSGGPAEPGIELSPEEERLCREYGQAKLWLNLAEFGIPLLALAALTFSGTAAWMLAHHPDGQPDWVGHLVFLIQVGVVARLTLFPIQYLSEHWLDRRYGLSCQGFGSWLWEWLCRSTVFGVATIVLLFPVAETLRWWPWLALPLALPWCGAFLVLRTWFYEHVYHPLQACFYPVHFLRFETFALPGVGKVTLPVYQVQVSHKTRRANACIRVRGKKTAIYVTDTLIDEFTDGEERVVMAHEFGHLYDQLHLEERTRAGVAQAHRKLVLGSAQLLAGGVSLFLMHFLSPVFGLHGLQDLAGFPLLAALTLGLAYAFSPLLCSEARRDERDADEYALAITGDVSNYVSVMRKLRQMNLEESGSHPWSRMFFDTHPTYRERVHLARQYRRRHPQRRKAPHWRGWRHIQHHGRR